MQVIDKKDKNSSKKYKERKYKNQRKDINLYNSLLTTAEDLGIVSIDFNNICSYKKRIKILNSIINKERK